MKKILKNLWLWYVKQTLISRIHGSEHIVDFRLPIFIEAPEKVSVAGALYIGPEAFWGAKGGLKIGKNVIFGPRVSIWTYNHDYSSGESIPYGGPDVLKEVIIEDNVWIGFGAIILPGTVIKEGAIIGAGAVVSGTVEPCAIYAGNPARQVKHRNQAMYQELKSQNKLYLYKKFDLAQH
jgi:acetyltransferase-like isoleucine patch superfamily enzyme